MTNSDHEYLIHIHVGLTIYVDACCLSHQNDSRCILRGKFGFYSLLVNFDGWHAATIGLDVDSNRNVSKASKRGADNRI